MIKERKVVMTDKNVKDIVEAGHNALKDIKAIVTDPTTTDSFKVEVVTRRLLAYASFMDKLRRLQASRKNGEKI